MSSADPLPVITPPARVTFVEVKSVSARVAHRGLAALLSSTSPAFEAIRVLRTKVKALGEQRFVHCLGLVGATAGEGTSSLALGLAAAIAQEPARRVLLVETGLREPKLEGMLGLAEEPGLADWLSAASERSLPLRRVEPWGFFLLAGGTPTPQPIELLTGDRLPRLIASASQSFDIVLLDCPSLETVADSAIIQDLVDGFLLVVRARHASRDAVRRSLSFLKQERVLGVVLNDQTNILSRWLDRRRRRDLEPR